MTCVPTAPAPAAPRHLLLLEPRAEGHHLTWLRMVLEDLLLSDIRITLALDHAVEAAARWREQLSDLLDRVACIPVDVSHKGHSRVSAAAASEALVRSGADEIFMGALDEFGSTALRRAAFGFNLPSNLHQRWSGIYHRPRYLECGFSLNHWLKRVGMARLLRSGWYRRIFLVDEFLWDQARSIWPTAPFFFLPTPCSQSFSTPASQAREKLGLPLDRKIFLFFGGGSRRKGLHVALEAFQELPDNFPAYLLVAGQQLKEPKLIRQMTSLEQAGRARIINRYVTTAEEELCFCASDYALLPYLDHFGTSAVLSNAVEAGLSVFASDGQLLGRRVRTHGLGWLFPGGDARALRACMISGLQEPAAEGMKRQERLRNYASQNTRRAFRTALMKSFGLSIARSEQPRDTE
jgi:glycosyltransferase involved in cell wall biosynthesis